jgi:hypothetical protein
MRNKLFKLDMALGDKTFKWGLASYTQSNCQVTLTDDGFRIYRPPNLTQSNDGNTMYGGLVMRPFTNGPDADDSNFLIKNHTYIFLCHIRGQSSSAFTSCIMITNNAGWSGANYGLTTELSGVSNNNIPSNFNGELDLYYKFTVAGDIWKVCTQSYSSFVQGTSYNCYRDWMLGFGYGNTGTLGTDLYLTRFRCYDITNGSELFNMNKNGTLNLNWITEQNPITRITSAKEILTNEIYEI